MIQDNKRLVQDYLEAWTKADENKLERLLADRFKFNNPPPGIEPDKQGAIEMAKMFRSAFPDLSVKVNDIITEGDKVAASFVGTGTHKGEFMGVAPTNKKTDTTGLVLITVKDGKIVKDHTEFDALGLLTELGAVPQQLTRAV